jgi:hypothetical protein
MATITRRVTRSQPRAKRPDNAREGLVREGETINAPPKAARVAPTFVILNKNFLNYPMARDLRTIGRWRQGANTGRWIGRLPGDNKIRYFLPTDVDPKLKRCPSAFDVNVLFLLLAESKKQNRNEIELPSRSYILRALGLGADSKNRNRLGEALALWSMLTIQFNNWYFPPEWSHRRMRQPPKNDVKKLPPPIRSVTLDQRVQITLNGHWLELDKIYYQKVPLPLPAGAAAQNLALCLLVTMKAVKDTSLRRRVRQLCRKLGLNHHERLQSLKHAYDSVEKYFNRNHLRQLSDYMIQDGKILFMFDRAKQRPKIKTKNLDANQGSDRPKIKQSKPRTRTISQEIEEGLTIERVIPIGDNDLPIPMEDQQFGRVGHWVGEDA